MENWFLVHFVLEGWLMCFEFAFPCVLIFAGVLIFSLLSVLNILQTEGKSTEQEAFPLDIKDFIWFLGQKRGRYFFLVKVRRPNLVRDLLRPIILSRKLLGPKSVVP